MKKFISVILAIVLVFSLCACGSSSNDESTPDNVLPENIKIGLVCLHDENSPYDNNFITAFKAACEATNSDYEIKTNISESGDCYDAACELADNGCNIVFADSFGHEDYIILAAQEFPNVEFCHATGTMAHSLDLNNFHNVFASIYEGRYIDGIALGMKLNEMIAAGDITEDEAIVGYVGAHQYAEVISGYTSFFLGVRSVCPSAIMKVTFTGSWYDETLEKEAANNLIQAGCVALSGHADSMGMPTACEKMGIPFVFYNGSVISACPNTFIVSTRINWQPYFEYIINCVKNGETIDTDWVGTIATNSVVMSEVNEAVAANGTADAIKVAIDKFNAKELNVFDCSTFAVNGETITSYEADVNTDENYTPDTEVIENGVFYESKFRSAPYFDITIDGITIIS